MDLLSRQRAGKESQRAGGAEEVPALKSVGKPRAPPRLTWGFHIPGNGCLQKMHIYCPVSESLSTCCNKSQHGQFSVRFPKRRMEHSLRGQHTEDLLSHSQPRLTQHWVPATWGRATCSSRGSRFAPSIEAAVCRSESRSLTPALTALPNSLLHVPSQTPPGSRHRRSSRWGFRNTPVKPRLVLEDSERLIFARTVL